MSSQVFGETQNYMRRNSVRDVIVAKAINNGSIRIVRALMLMQNA